MCGIAGVLSAGSTIPADVDAVRAMIGRLRHRGPDGEGVVADGPAALGHRRLAIIDLSPDAAQPLANEDGTIRLVVNGEIYNFADLREGLVARGHRFRSRSDSEVIVHLYEEAGAGCLERLRGMFALALWDGRRRQLLLARDRFGKKPLYYAPAPRGVFFASELQALVASNAFGREVDLEAVDDYLALQYVPAPRSIYRGVFKLPAGHRLLLEPGRPAEPEPYFQFRFGPPSARPMPELAGELRHRIDEAVRIRMVADVPVGAFLSGGIDSSTVVACMARHASGPVRTFSIGFPEADRSELPFARLVARRYGTDHHEMIVDPEMTSIVPRLVEHYGEPFGDSSAIPTWYLAEFTKRHVTVSLSGDAGDEAFGGYNRYRFANLARGIGALPAPAVRGLSWLLGRLRSPRAQRVRDFGRRLAEPPIRQYLGLVAHFTHEERQAIYSAEMGRLFAADRQARLFEEVVASSLAADPLGRLTDLDIRTYLPGDILVKVDIASMAHALEVRSPLLDQEVMALAATIPTSMKVRGLATKRILRAAAAEWLPREVLRRFKKGFDLPMDRWMREDLREMSRDLLLDGTARSRGLFDPAAVERLHEAHQRGESRGQQLWNLLMLEHWFRTFADRAPSPEAIAAPC